MNLDKVKYPYMVVKWKESGAEITWGNTLKLSNQMLQRILPGAIRSLHVARIHATKE